MTVRLPTAIASCPNSDIVVHAPSRDCLDLSLLTLSYPPPPIGLWIMPNLGVVKPASTIHSPKRVRRPDFVHDIAHLTQSHSSTSPFCRGNFALASGVHDDMLAARMSSQPRVPALPSEHACDNGPWRHASPLA